MYMCCVKKLILSTPCVVVLIEFEMIWMKSKPRRRYCLIVVSSSRENWYIERYFRASKLFHWCVRVLSSRKIRRRFCRDIFRPVFWTFCINLRFLSCEFLSFTDALYDLGW